MEQAPPLTPSQQARTNYILGQMQSFQGAVRGLQVSLAIANMNQELPPEFKEHLLGQVLQVAAMLETQEEAK